VDIRRERDLESGGVVEVAVERTRRFPIAGAEIGQTSAAERHHCGLAVAHYSFNAPDCTFMIRFWKKKNRTATGIVIKHDAASFSG